MVTNRKKGLHLATQERLLKKYFPEGRCWQQNSNKLIWEGYLTPGAFSISYKIKMEYEIGDSPKVYVTEPEKLSLFPGKDKLEHVYNQKQQHLCLYYPLKKEWNSSMLLANTILPWAAEWLYFYEIWLATGDWKGGGYHIGDNN